MTLLSRLLTSQGLKQISNKQPGGVNVILQCGLTSKAMRDPDYVKPKPFDYKKWSFNVFHALYDRTTTKFDENTKLIVVEGAHAVGKTDFAKELADEFGMHFMPPVTMDGYYKDGYGNDLRNYNNLLLPKNKTYDEKDFVRDPTGPVEGSADRFLLRKFELKYYQYIDALRHILSTGEGVVLESSLYTDYIQWDAAHKEGWIESGSRDHMYKCLEYTLPHLLRPNMVIYLDAPVDVVQKNIATRGNEWDKNSPVWSNDRFLDGMYTAMKRDYLKKIQDHSQVLVYDWSEPGDMEVVVEDVEAVNLDEYGLYEEQQADWRLYNEENANRKRYEYCNSARLTSLYRDYYRVPHFDCPQLYLVPDEIKNLQDIHHHMKGAAYHFGYNKCMGDPEPMFRLGQTFRYEGNAMKALIPDMMMKRWYHPEGF